MLFGCRRSRSVRMRVPLHCVQVFGVYGIGVDKRHLGLIGDYMMHQVQVSLGSR